MGRKCEELVVVVVVNASLCTPCPPRPAPKYQHEYLDPSLQCQGRDLQKKIIVILISIMGSNPSLSPSTVRSSSPFWLRRLSVAGDYHGPPEIPSPSCDIYFRTHISEHVLDCLIFATIRYPITKSELSHVSGVFSSNDNVGRKSGEPLGEA